MTGLLGQVQPRPVQLGEAGSRLSAPVGFTAGCLDGIVKGLEAEGHKAGELRKSTQRCVLGSGATGGSLRYRKLVAFHRHLGMEQLPPLAPQVPTWYVLQSGIQ